MNLEDLTPFELLKREAEVSMRNCADVDEAFKREDDAAKLRAESRGRGMIKGGAVA